MKFNFEMLPVTGSTWRTFAVCAIACAMGLGFFIMREAEVVSYLSDIPQACVNCHVMTPKYNSCMHTSHREWGACNGCHVPKEDVFISHYFKAKDGLYHSAVFTARAELDVITMREAS